MEILYVFMAGASVGSFLNVCISRIPKGQGVTFSVSKCPDCGTRIELRDLVPMLSYALLRGRCRACGGAIHWRYPAVELAAGLAFAALYMKYGASLEFLKLSVLASFLIVAGIIDLETGEVHTSLIAAGASAGLAFAVVAPGTLADSLLGALLGFGVIAAIALTGGMGWGDSDICLLCGLFLGVKLTLLMLLLSFLLGAAAGTALIGLSVRGRKDSIPFGPFLAVSAISVSLFGNSFLLLYNSVMF
jgi:leader peptidase (prepilin peptidase)/N-methyltransferase